jgi:serine/threonine protein kinase
MGGRDKTEHGAAAPAPLAADLLVGTELAGYQLESLLGRGGMGVVYRAKHLHLGRTAALKLLVPEIADEAGFRERFLRESQIAAALQHPNIVTVYDAGETEGLLYIAMQYVDGTDLATTLKESGALEPDRALSILGQVADALDTAHAAGIVHRDVKPGNVLMDSQRSYLTDFGLTRRISSESGLTRKGQFVGTIDYMPPEQIEGRPVDGRTDVYALGCVLYHALAGAVPYQKDSEVSVIYAHMQEPPPSLVARRPGLPGELDAVIAKAMAKFKEERYGSCTELVSAARSALGQSTPTAAVSGAPPLPARRVLIADDDGGIRAMVRVSLGNGRFEVIDAADGEEAIALAQRERPDLLFVDWGLPGRSGAEVCAALRSGSETAQTKIIAVVPRADGVDERAIRAAGADDYLRKPFSSVQLLSKVGGLLGTEALSL